MKANCVVLAAVTGIVALAAFGAALAEERSSTVLVSPKAREVVVRMRRVHHKAATETFALAADVHIHVGTNTNAAMTDLPVGSVAHVRYTIENGLWVAHEIVVNQPKGGHSPKPEAGELHAHGAILGYDLNNGLVTIKHSR